MAEERIPLTRAGYDTLQHELAEARERAQRATEQLASVDNSADDNIPEEGAEFDIRTTQEYYNERARHLEFVLRRAEVIEEDPDPERLNVGDRVVVWDFEDNRERTFEIVSGVEAVEREDVISADSPVGRALLGKRIGDIVSIEVPDGVTRYSVRRMVSSG
jgi:transcription elongation factor GreA